MTESTEEHQDEQSEGSDVEEQRRPIRHEDEEGGDDSGEESEVEEQRRPVR